MKRLNKLIPLLLLLCVGPMVAQDATDCPAIVETVLANLDNICDGTGRNEACYGNIELDVQAREGATDFKFNEEGDLVSVADIQALRLTPLDEASNVWGVALMQLQASLPDTLPGQNVTFVLFGDVELVNAVPEDSDAARPMQAFYLRTGISDAACAEAPESGLLVRTPEGRGQITFALNGVDVALGSSVFFQSAPGQDFITRVYEGSAALRTPDGTFPLIAGTQRSIPMSADFKPAGPPSELTTFEIQEAEELPPYKVIDPNMAPPPVFSPAQINAVNNLTEEGRPLCDLLPFLPDCEDLIEVIGGDKCPIDDNGDEICGQEPETIWDEEVIDPYIPPVFDDEEDISDVPEDPISELPEGCYDGVCLADPAEACQCALCGVVCPVETEAVLPDGTPQASPPPTGNNPPADGFGSGGNPPPQNPGQPTEPPPDVPPPPPPPTDGPPDGPGPCSPTNPDGCIPPPVTPG